MKIAGLLLIITGLLIIVLYSNYLYKDYFQKYMKSERKTTKYIYIFTEFVSFSPYSIAIVLLLAGFLLILY